MDMDEHDTDGELARERAENYARRVTEEHAREAANETAKGHATQDARRHARETAPWAAVRSNGVTGIQLNSPRISPRIALFGSSLPLTSTTAGDLRGFPKCLFDVFRECVSGGESR